MTYDDIRYAPYLRHLWSLLKNLKKGKWRSILRRFYDAKYRADINHQWRVTGMYGKLSTFRTTMPLQDLHASHDINYEDWVGTLCEELRISGKLQPIKVIYDAIKNQWMVIDGNHRLEAYKCSKLGTFDVPVIVLYPKNAMRQELENYLRRAR